MVHLFFFFFSFLTVLLFLNFTFQKQLPRGVLQKKVFLEISQISQENTCARDSFLMKLQAYLQAASHVCVYYSSGFLAKSVSPGNFNFRKSEI